MWCWGESLGAVGREKQPRGSADDSSRLQLCPGRVKLIASGFKGRGKRGVKERKQRQRGEGNPESFESRAKEDRVPREETETQECWGVQGDRGLARVYPGRVEKSILPGRVK